MDKSVFISRKVTPGDGDLFVELKETYDLWYAIRNHVHDLYPEAVDEWHFSGNKFGWSFRVNDKKSVILYLLPRDGYFKVAFVFGRKATDAVMRSTVVDKIKQELSEAKVYAEGRGIRIDVRDASVLEDIRELVAVKLSD